MSSLCPNCGTALKTSKNNWIYCPSHYNTPPCPYKGKPGYQKKKVYNGDIEPLENPSSEQKAIFSKVGQNLVVEALAGTGKTTALVQLIREATKKNYSCLALAFARNDKEQIEEKCKSKATVLTSNGAGYKILQNYTRNQGVKRLDVNARLSYDVLQNRLREDGLIVEKEWKIKWSTVQAIVSLVEQARIALPLRAPKEPTEQEFDELAQRFGIEWDGNETNLVKNYAVLLFRDLANLKNLLVWGCDYTGQVFLPVYHSLEPDKKFDIVLVDEAQDQNNYNRALAITYLNPTGKFVIVGDRNQAIYEWRGADSNSMDDWIEIIKSKGEQPEILPLTECRRCCKVAIRRAQTIVPGIRALPDAPEGEEVKIQENEVLNSLASEKTALVISRINTPLVSLCLRLLAIGKTACLARGNVVTRLLGTIEKISNGNNNQTVSEFMVNLEEWRNEQLGKLAKRRDGEQKSVVVNDLADCLVALAETVATAGELKKKVDEIFPKDWETRKNGILLSTVHGAKGGEAETVYLYSPPPKKKETVSIFDKVWTNATDRDNTLYVAVTRTKTKLVIVGPEPTWRRFSQEPLRE